MPSFRRTKVTDLANQTKKTELKRQDATTGSTQHSTTKRQQSAAVPQQLAAPEQEDPAPTNEGRL
jgi:hypothetical protein